MTHAFFMPLKKYCLLRSLQSQTAFSNFPSLSTISASSLPSCSPNMAGMILPGDFGASFSHGMEYSYPRCVTGPLPTSFSSFPKITLLMTCTLSSLFKIVVCSPSFLPCCDFVALLSSQNTVSLTYSLHCLSLPHWSVSFGKVGIFVFFPPLLCVPKSQNSAQC